MARRLACSTRGERRTAPIDVTLDGIDTVVRPALVNVYCPHGAHAPHRHKPRVNGGAHAPAALSGDRYYNGNYTLEKVWKASAAQGDSIDVYEYDPRCNNGLVFYFGVVVAVLSLCQVCCFMGGNSPGGHDPDDDDMHSDDENGSPRSL